MRSHSPVGWADSLASYIPVAFKCGGHALIQGRLEQKQGDTLLSCISAFIVEKTFDGLTTGNKENKLGIRGSDTCELYFYNCKVPSKNLSNNPVTGPIRACNINIPSLYLY